ncbi:hypothetical protein OIDMADRAFT_26594 [Oidiodendron maius Zn]|uniref:Phosphoglycerate mutase family protein n=1 Tax=Oidiodendron maius (strain Zn) TaxID=913774 RepID=A0A0C3H6Y3_OIDMZ|nr:hypothetical protein OIDMADRAFT_26594 [Oidiodendron maius Zn]
MSSPLRSASRPDFLTISTCPLCTNIKCELTCDDESGDVSENLPTVFENPQTNMPVAPGASVSSLVIPFTSDLNETASPQIAHQVRSLVADEGLEASTAALPHGIEDNEIEPSETLGATTPTSIPVSIADTIRREPKITIHFIRHAHAAHNIKNLLEAYSIQNPALTPFGHTQCELVLKTFPFMDKVTHVLCSPLTRALETALESFKPLYERGLQIVAWTQLLETGNGPTNRGDSISDLRKKMKGLPVDLQYINEGWEKVPNKSADGPARAKSVMITLHNFCQLASRFGENVDRPDVDLLVVSHGTFLRNLIRGRPRFLNCQVRSCEFATEEQAKGGSKHFDLVETAESKARVYKLDRLQPPQED